MTVAKEPGHRGEHDIRRKTIACGNAGRPGVLVVTRVRSTNTKCTRGCGCSRHPAFPTPSMGAKDKCNDSGASRGEDEVVCETIATSLRGAKRRSNPFFLYAARWIASRSLSSGAHSRDPVDRNDDAPERKRSVTFPRRDGPEVLLET